ncbi:MAG TPA: cupin domain-containing protein [Chitinophagaceae bacterium]|nr:cupin domain-containing protein [Chitinophagaceae bacterium]
MKGAFLLLLTISVLQAFPQSITKRVVHNNPANYRLLSAVHAGAGQMKFAELIGREALATNFLYLHAGEIFNKGGIGQHFHHTIEEMYVILDGEAEFTVNGHTSRIKGPALVPCKKGDAHGIYNSSGKTIRWLNFAVSSTKARGDNFDLGDSLVRAKLDPVPQFVSSQLKKGLLKPGSTSYTGNGVLYRRILGPEIFSTNWNHVDHVVVPAGSTGGRVQPAGVDEVYYVIKGAGTIATGSDSAMINADDSFFSSSGENFRFSNNAREDLELLVIGIAASRQKVQGGLNPLAKPKAMVLQMDFIVEKEKAEAFEKMYTSIYVPAMLVQQGYLESKLLRLYPDNLAKEIEAEPTTYNYQILISFDTEVNRRKWVASAQHQVAWPAATSLAKQFKWRGYDVMGDDSR